MRGAGTRAGPQPSLLTVPASWDLFVLMRETPIIGFSTTAKRRKPSCRAGAPPGGASGRSPIPPRRGAAGPPRPPPSFPPAPQPPQPRLPRLPRQRQPRARHHPRYVRTAGPGRAGPRRQQRRVRPRGPQLSRRGQGAAAGPPRGGDTRIEGAGPRPQRRSGRPADSAARAVLLRDSGSICRSGAIVPVRVFVLSLVAARFHRYNLLLLPGHRETVFPLH